MSFTLQLILALAAVQGADVDPLDQWPQWRGPLGNGVAPKADPPTEWSESKNIKWKVALPGHGSATPVVWGHQMFVLAAVKTERKAPGAPRPAQSGGRRGRRRMSTGPPGVFYRFEVLSLDPRTGKTLWQKTATEAVPHEGVHPSHGYASASPVTDGKRLYAFFGSRGIFCYDLKGELLWKRDLGEMRIKVGFGEAISPAVHGDALLINWDHEGDSFLACLDAATGKERWRTPRNERTTWATPFFVERNGKTQVVVNGSRVRSYDLATGKLIWDCGGMSGNPIPMPLVEGSTVLCMTGYQRLAFRAIPLDGSGDLSSKTVWSRTDAGSYVSSPVLVDGLVYLTKERRGILQLVDAKSGDLIIEGRRLPDIDMMYASLAAAAGKVFVIGRSGTTAVLAQGREAKLLATNRLDEGVDASPVLIGKRLYLRGSKHLYCIEAE